MEEITPAFNLKPFIESIENDSNRATRIFEDLAQFADGPTESDYISEYSEYVDNQKREVKYILQTVRLKIIYVLESLKLPRLLQEFLREFQEKEGTISEWTFSDEGEVLYNKIVGLIWKYNEILKIQLDKTTNNEQLRFLILERVLHSIPDVIFERNIAIKSEKDVHNEVFLSLKHIFTEVYSEVKIPKPIKPSKLDIGIRDLGCVIEVKYACSEKEVRVGIEGIMADVMAYNGTKEWNTFYAFIYMTEQFWPIAKIEEEFRISGLKKNWKVISVVGKGSRK